jgi:hypothetical protein
MAQHTAKPAPAFLLAPNEQPKQPARDTGSGKAAKAACTAERLARCPGQIHLASRRAGLGLA